jgi:hypothetical protein
MISNQKLPDLKTLKRLRFKDGLSLQAIGERYGASRERVRQKLAEAGGTGGREFIMGYMTKNLKANPDQTTTQAIASFEPGQHGVGVMRKKMSSIHHKVKRDGSANWRGHEAEEYISDKLNHMGIQNELMPLHSPYDIKLSSGVKVEIKSAFTDFEPGKGQKSTVYKFRVSKNTRGNYFDFLICYIQPTGDFFVIPGDKIGKIESLYITWPASKQGAGKWHEFHNRFDLLKGGK